MKKKIQLLLILGLLVTGCSSVAHLQTDDVVKQIAESNPSTVEVFSVNKINKDYLVLGKVIVSADAGGDASTSVNQLKNEAAKLGADAIIDLRLAIGYGYFSNAITASGTAVKYINK
jgi:protein involved in sex pheromone biosynthesis